MNNATDINLQFAQAFPEPLLQPHAWLLAHRLKEGHICIDITDLPEPANPAGWYASPQQLTQIPKWVGNDQATTPFILHRNKLYLHRYFQYETNILRHIKRLLKTEEPLLEARKKALLTQSALITSLKADYSLTSLPANERPDWSLAAVIMTCLHHFTILTGGPGTGKTTTVAKILWVQYILQPNCRIALAAPTGKAATRMADSLQSTTLPLPDSIRNKLQQLQPVTLHQLLGTKQDDIYFRHNENNPLPYDLVIVDECSMIDVALFAKLLSAIGSSTRILLLGDKNQLASVEAGSLFGDLCSQAAALNAFSSDTQNFINRFIETPSRSLPISTNNTPHPLAEHIIELQYSHRFSTKSGIGRLSDAILHNRTTILDEFLLNNNGGEVSITSPDSDSALLSFIDGYEAYIHEPDIYQALQLFQQQRILCAVREGKGGLAECNQLAESHLKKNNCLQPDTPFYENRPIIITRNNKELGLVNGDVGIVRTIQGTKKLWLDAGNGQVRGISVQYIQHAETVFAMTIHKSQGSEYNRVLIRMPNHPDIPILTRELLYTAVTRAKQQAIILSSELVLKATASGSVQRASGITHRMDEL
ncbi:MAG: exodeoxyribonuclease V subunit alpha [Bacteroidetes bacterium]|nr:exodeoxyribonuclease V subunit alpha [Bacteroidota bacterium]